MVRSDMTGAACETIASLPYGDGRAIAGSCGDPSTRHFTGKERDSHKSCPKAVETDPTAAAFLDTLATAYFEAQQPDKAAEAERQALTLKPDDPSYKNALDKYLAAAKQ
jgi:hypothetical protein